jgi:hypothetical protein
LEISKKLLFLEAPGGILPSIAMKETLFPELDRNSASPTESADGGKATIGNTPELTV